MKANEAKKLLEAGNRVTAYGNGYYVFIEYAETANEDGERFYWVNANDENEDGYWERQESWKATLAYLKELGVTLEEAEYEKAA